MLEKESNSSGSSALSGKAGLWMIVIFVVGILSTALYVAVNGYDKWKGDMKTAAVYLQAGAGNVNPADRVLQPVPVAKKTKVARQAGQFTCPICGGTGLPDYAANGDPVCQVCRHKVDVTYFK
ncbi:hypothetical protein WDW37_06890 [Bdellovibrionota bacterium FG-1]